MPRRIRKLLVANRSEIAIRVFRAAHELGIRTVAIYSHEDRFALHRFKADEAYPVGTRGEPVRAYLDIEGIVARRQASTASTPSIPGYGFLSENADFARACAEAGIASSARASRCSTAWATRSPPARSPSRPASRCSPAATSRCRTTAEARSARRGARLSRSCVKAAMGGGGRGMRVVRDADAARRGASTRPSARRAPRSACRTCSSRSSSAAPGTSRCRSSATGTASSSTSSSATARCSAAIRRSSRSRPPPNLDPTDARGDLCDAAVEDRPRGRLRQRRHRRIPGRRGHGRVLLHRGQSAHPGRAHRHRGGDRRRHRPVRRS